MSDVAQDEFVESLKDRLVEAGKKNVVIIEPGESSRKKAMENVAEAFSDPVNDFIEKKSRSGESSGDVVSYDGTVSVNKGLNPATGEPVTNLSVRDYVTTSVNNHNVDVSAHEDIRAAIAAETAAREAAVLRIAPPEYAGTGEVIFYRGELV